MTDDRPQDPRTRRPRPDFPQQGQEHPGRTGPVDPPPDHGEDSSRGSGLLRMALPHMRAGASIIDTASVQAYQPSPHPLDHAFGKQAPLGRPAQSAGTAPAHVCLAAERASFVTAWILNATGGTPLP
ncbi:hypothetical protein ABZ858_07645 [Streptomyces sp. NPDC047017]|uniref:hypothetical protein n=1 Tax=Streptomyces sp. NPDC047017 TaxID=3155024 RepID=UPI00340F669C